MISDWFLRLGYDAMGMFMSLLPDAGPPPGWLTGSFAAVGSLEPIVPATDLFRLLGVWSTLYGSLVTFRIVRFVLGR